MKELLVPEDLKCLIREGGFQDESTLVSFALALGIFNDLKGDLEDISDRISPETLRSYTLSALIISEGGTRDLDMEEMRKLMLKRIAGGFGLLRERIKGKVGSSALKEVARMIPRA